MSKKQVRSLLGLLLVVIVTLILVVMIMSALPFTAADPVGTWQKVVEWFIRVRTHFVDFYVLYGILLALVFGGGYLYSKGK